MSKQEMTTEVVVVPAVDTAVVPVPATEKKSVEVGFSADVRKALADFENAKRAIKDLEDVKKNAGKILADALGDAQIATIGGAVAFTLVSRNRTDINRKMLAEMFPEIYSAVVYDNPYTYIDTPLK